jgi:SAM-dependent methyltransferase
MDNVKRYYDSEASYEWERLIKDAYHGLEFRATMAGLKEHLPPQGLVLDAGGGPGRYAIELCRRGYSVVLLDLSEQCISMAREQFAAEPAEVSGRLQSAEVGDIRDLSRFADDTFEAVLCLGGPLSHVIDLEDRRKALSELRRVGRPGAPMLVSVIGYYAHWRTVLARFIEDIGKPERERLLSSGDHLYAGGFPDTHFFRPDELQALAEEVGIETVELRACEGLSSNLREATNALAEHTDGPWEWWLRVLDHTSRDPGPVATSEHFLYVGRVPLS